MFTGKHSDTNAAHKLGQAINLLGVIGFVIILIALEPGINILVAFGSLIGNLALGTILITLGNIQRLLELDTIEIEDK